MSDARRRELFRKTASDPSNIEYEARSIADNVRTEQIPRRNVELAAILGHPAACRFLDREVPQYKQVLDLAIALGEAGGIPIYAEEARAIIRAVIESENLRGDLDADSEEWEDPIRLLNLYLETPVRETAQAFVDAADTTLGGVPQGTISGLPTMGGVSSYMLLLHNIVYNDTVDENNVEEIAPDHAMSQLIRLATNSDFGAGLSEDQIREAITNEFLPNLLQVQE